MRNYVSFLSLMLLFVSLSVFANYSMTSQITRKGNMIFGVDFPLAANWSDTDLSGEKGRICNTNAKLCNFNLPIIV